MHRYDIESFFRFSKQQLLLHKYQSPDVQHLDAWVQACSLAHCLLYLLADQSPINVPKWQQYLPEVKQAIEQMKKQNEPASKKSPAITRKGADSLLSTLEWTEFAPQESKYRGLFQHKSYAINRCFWTNLQRIKAQNAFSLFFTPTIFGRVFYQKR